MPSGRRWLLLLPVAMFIAGCDRVGEAGQVVSPTVPVKRADGTAFFKDTASGELDSSLRIALTFPGEVDLDLYVTGPLLETVYFANHTSRSGGEISDDVRCDTQGEHIERVYFAAPMPGRYRIGVDFPESCFGDVRTAAFAVVARYEEEKWNVEGSVELQQFNVAVLEFEI
jgi:uncharacterized protein YfaP (DUF2135 family)